MNGKKWLCGVRKAKENVVKLKRKLFCPICGAGLSVETVSGFPEALQLPDHQPAADVNLCMGLVVTVTIDFDRCRKCGGKMAKNGSDLCLRCFCEEYDDAE